MRQSQAAAAPPRLPAPRALIHLLYWHLPRLFGGRLALVFVVACVWLPTAASWRPLLALTALAAYLGLRGAHPGIAFVRSVIGAEQAPLFLLGAALAPTVSWALHARALVSLAAPLGGAAGVGGVDAAVVWALHALWAVNLCVFGWSSYHVMRARSLIRRAFEARGFGAAGSPLARGLAKRFWPSVVSPWGRLVAPRVRRARGLVLARVDGSPLTADVYVPDTLTDDTPIVLLLHGGGWVLGNLDVYFPEPLAMRLAQEGCLVVKSVYRLAPETPFPGQLHDCKRAIAWIRGPQFPFRGDKARLMVGGESAGGNVALLAALTGNHPALQPPEIPDADTRVAACVDLFGIHSLLDAADVGMGAARLREHWRFCEEWFLQVPYRPEDPSAMAVYEAASPTRWVRKLSDGSATASVPPILTFHGMQDVTVPFRDAELFHESLARLREAQPPPAGAVPDVFVPLPGAGHAFCMWPGVRALAVADAVCCFVSHVVRASRAAPAPPKNRMAVPEGGSGETSTDASAGPPRGARAASPTNGAVEKP